MAELEGNANLTEMGWHERYAHLSFPAFPKVSEAPLHHHYSKLQCNTYTCIKIKSIKPPSLIQEIRTSMVEELVHSFLRSPFPTTDIRGNKYMLTLVDDYSRLTITRCARSTTGDDPQV